MKSRSTNNKRTPWRLRAQTAKDVLALAPPPCFYFAACKSTAVGCRNGKALCAKCAARFTGPMYPLRHPMPPLVRMIDGSLEIRGAVAN
jgi:hypothetical protein